MVRDHLAVLAEQAAILLPEPAGPHDPFGYLAWEELVLSTARRLLLSAGGALPPGCADAVVLESGSDRLSGAGLLRLAALLQQSGPAAGEFALAQAMT